MELSSEGNAFALQQRKLFSTSVIETRDTQDKNGSGDGSYCKPRPATTNEMTSTGHRKLSRLHNVTVRGKSNRQSNVTQRDIATDGRNFTKRNDNGLPLMIDVPVRMTSRLSEVVPEPEPATDHHDKPSEETTHITHSDQDLPTALATPTEVDQMESETTQTQEASRRKARNHTETVSIVIRPPSTTNEPEESEKIVEAKLKRSYVLQELLETEGNYVTDLTTIVDKYMDHLSTVSLPDGLAGKSKIVFGNIRAILNFHKSKFLPDIEEFHEKPQELGQLFTKYEKHLRLYITYCENKPKSEYLVSEYAQVFKELDLKVGSKLSLQDLLIKPVQRIMKYQLLLKDILKYTERTHESAIPLHKAMDVMLTVPKAANNMMEVGRLEGFEVRLPVHGTILLQDTLPVAEFKIKKSGQRKYRDRRVFLFEQIVVISEVAERFTGHYYKHRMNIKLADLRLVEKVFEEPTSFILSDAKHTSIDVYIAAPNFKVKEDWIHQINELLDKQHNFLALLQDPLANMKLGEKSSRASRSSSDRSEPLLNSMNADARQVKSFH